jgi:hypothetical protein
MKYDLINTVYNAIDRFETVEDRSEVLKGLSSLLKEDFQKYKRVLSEFAESARTQEDYDRLRVAVVGAPLPPKPTVTEILANCLNGQYGRGTQLTAERIKNNGPSRDLMMRTLVTLLKPYGFTLTEDEILTAIEEL